MKNRPLFDDLPPPPASVVASTHLRVRPGPAGAPLSAAAKAYNLQLARIDKLKTQMAAMDALAQAHRQALMATVFPLEQRQQALMKAMALRLDGYLDPERSRAKLTPKQRETAQAIVRELSAGFAAQGDADMAALHDRHSPTSLARMERERLDALRAELEAMVGEPLLPDQPDASLDVLMRAAAAHIQNAHAAKDAAREAAAAKRKAKKAAQADPKPPTAAQLLQQGLQTDAEASLRRLYRQLASALHPDRETDPTLHAQKTALMSEANAAYARKDLVTLMDIQQRAALADPGMVAGLPDDKLKALTLLVKAQVAELERQRAGTQQALQHEFGLPMGFGLNAKNLELLRLDREDDLNETLLSMQEDLAIIEEEAAFKRWLTQQRKLSQQQARMDALFDPSQDWMGEF